MTAPQTSLPLDFTLPRSTLHHGANSIPAPTHTEFIAHFGDAFPAPVYLQSDHGQTAVYDLPPSAGRCTRPILFVHGLNTPALGMLSLARELQSLEPTAHIVLFDLWGHGMSSTPLVPHTPSIFHFQILQVLSYMKWSAAHIVGYSFGGSTAATFVTVAPWAALSVTLLAPVGLMNLEQALGSELLGLLEKPEGREAQARERILSWLEGGPLVVPDNWLESSKRGVAVAEALRDWELRKHRGFAYSVLSMFQDGGVDGREESFRKLAGLPVKKLAVLADSDPVCSKELLAAVDVHEVVTVAQADHGFARSKAGETAAILVDFWTK